MGVKLTDLLNVAGIGITISSIDNYNQLFGLPNDQAKPMLFHGGTIGQLDYALGFNDGQKAIFQQAITIASSRSSKTPEQQQKQQQERQLNYLLGKQPKRVIWDVIMLSTGLILRTHHRRDLTKTDEIVVSGFNVLGRTLGTTITCRHPASQDVIKIQYQTCCYSDHCVYSVAVYFNDEKPARSALAQTIFFHGANP